MRTKADIRTEMARRRRALEPDRARVLSLRAQERLLALPAFAAARHVAAYLALPGEVAADRFLAAARASGKRASVPAWRPEKDRYELTELAPDDRMVAGPWRTREPARKRWVPLTETDLIVVPGVAFDRRGRRLGRGGGHYDRLLADAAFGATAPTLKIGLLFDFQWVDVVPADEWDVGMDGLVTEKETLLITEKGG